jgi:hypothetical protein
LKGLDVYFRYFSKKYVQGSTCVLLKVAVKELNIVEVAEDERCVGGDAAAAPFIHVLFIKEILSQQNTKIIYRFGFFMYIIQDCFICVICPQIPLCRRFRIEPRTVATLELTL